MNVKRTVRGYHAAGLAGIMIEDQVTESARALAVTIQVSRYRKHVNFGC